MYGVFWINGRDMPAHRVSYSLYKGNIPKGLCVLHKCDVPACVNPNHLFLGTLQDNVADMISKNRQRSLKGEDHPNSKLKNEDVLFIRSNTISPNRLAQKYKVRHSTIINIRKRRIWKHI